MTHAHKIVVSRFIGAGARSYHGANLFYDADTRRLYSYGYHFPLAALHNGTNGRVMLLAATTPSSSTSKHRAVAAAAARAGDIPCFFVPNHLRNEFSGGANGRRGYYSQPVVLNNPATHDAVNLNWLLDSARRHPQRIAIMRGDFLDRADGALNAACHQLSEARAYADAFGCQALLPPDLPVQAPRSVLRWVFPTPPSTGLARRNVALMLDLASETVA